MFPGLFVSGSPTPRISTSSTLLSLELWWKHYGCPSDFCGVYNDGKHVFVQDARSGHPGAFIDQPLSFFAFKERSIDVGDIWIAHFGHMFGLSGGNAIVRAFNSKRSQDLLIPPLHIAYVIQLPQGKLRCTTRCMPLPRVLLPLR